MLCDGQPLEAAGDVAGDERDAQTYTDTDFYSQLLQEFLGGKATSAAAYAPALSQVGWHVWHGTTSGAGGVILAVELHVSSAMKAMGWLTEYSILLVLQNAGIHLGLNLQQCELWFSGGSHTGAGPGGRCM